MIPFRHIESSQPANLNNTNRLRIYREFMGRETLKGEFSLDIGDEGYISKRLEVTDNTLQSDFNYRIETYVDGYSVITNFEVINHIMNPLLHLESCYNLLAPCGKMYLSHPKLWLIPWHHCKYDFVDYEVSRFIQMVEYAGFKVVRHKTYNPWPLRFMFYGFRPFFRVLFNRIEVYELRKP